MTVDSDSLLAVAPGIRCAKTVTEFAGVIGLGRWWLFVLPVESPASQRILDVNGGQDSDLCSAGTKTG